MDQTLNRGFFTELERRVDLAGLQAISLAPIYGGIDRHIRKGINLYGWNAVSEVLETR